MKKIQLTKGKFSLVDDEDYEKLIQWKWQLSSKGYACRSQRIGERKYNKKIAVWMHREIINATKELQVDHINGDKLDNRKSNLRLCTGTQNLGNVGVPKHNTSGYKGVSWDKSKNKYEAYITKRDKKVYLGIFDDKQKAAKAYNKAAKQYFGDFAHLNII